MVVCCVLVVSVHRVSRLDFTMGDLLMIDWIPKSKRLPDKLDAYDVTLVDMDGARLVNVAIFRPENSTWELMNDKHNYQDCRVIAWKPRSDPYQGKI